MKSASALTGRCHTNGGAQTAIQQKRLSDLPASSRLWKNGTPRQSTEWRPRDRKWFNHSSSALEKSGKQWRQEELSFFLRGERWATAHCRFRRTRKSRNTEVQDSGQSGDLPLDRAAAMSLPGFFFSERPRFAQLRTLPTAGQGAGVNRDWTACTPDCRRSRSAAPRTRPIKCEQTTHTTVL